MNFEQIQKNKEKKNKKEYKHIFEKNNEFFLYLNNKDDFVKIPKGVYRVIKIALFSEERSARDNDFDDSSKKYKKTIDKKRKINCHYTLFSPFKKNIKDSKKNGIENLSSSYNKKIFMDKELFEVKNVEDFKKKIIEKLENEKFGVSQMVMRERYENGRGGYIEYYELWHSFYMGVTETKDEVIVFEKAGNDGEFRVVGINEVFNIYHTENNEFDTDMWGVMKYSEFENKVNDNFDNKIL